MSPKLHNLPAIVGSVAQWVSAFAAIGVLSLGIYGLNKAVPYFENLNLREVNAQMQMENRHLDEKRQNLAQENARLDETARIVTAQLAAAATSKRRLGVTIVCSQWLFQTNQVLNDISQKTLFLSLALPQLSLNNPYPDYAITKRRTVATLLEAAKNDPSLETIDASDRKNLESELSRIQTTYGRLLELTLLPDSDPKAPTSLEYLKSIGENRKVVSELRNDVIDACLEVRNAIK